MMWVPEVYQVSWDVEETIEAEFKLQMLPAECDPTKTLLCFYDSGCKLARISDVRDESGQPDRPRSRRQQNDNSAAWRRVLLFEISEYDWRNEVESHRHGVMNPSCNE